MSKPEYEAMTVRELRSKARAMGLTGYSAMRREELLALLDSASASKPAASQKKGATAAASEPARKGKRKAAATKKKSGKPTAARGASALQKPKETAAVEPEPVVLPPPPPPTYEPFDEHRTLPHSYSRNRCILMLKSPEWYFLHWDFDQALERQILGAGGRPTLRVIRNGVRDKGLVDVMLLDRRHYFYVPGQEGQIKVELGGLFGTEFVPFLTSNPVDAMRLAPSTDDTIELVVPPWLEGTAGDFSKPLSRLEWERLYGPVPVDVPWYKARRPKAKK